MYFQTIIDEFNWVQYNGQNHHNVTYIFVSYKPVCRLRGYSDILYIGKTNLNIATRYNQETNTNNTPGNNQTTNIRLTYVFNEYGHENFCCYFVNGLYLTELPNEDINDFLMMLRTWDKNYYLKIINGDIQIPIEKYLLVRYANDHLEVPPLNNRM